MGKGQRQRNKRNTQASLLNAPLPQGLPNPPLLAEIQREESLRSAERQAQETHPCGSQRLTWGHFSTLRSDDPQVALSRSEDEIVRENLNSVTLAEEQQTAKHRKKAKEADRRHKLQRFLNAPPRRIALRPGEDEVEECSICLEEMDAPEQLSRLSCGHKFHHCCVEDWLANSCTCPCCNATVAPRTTEPPNKYTKKNTTKPPGRPKPTSSVDLCDYLAPKPRKNARLQQFQQDSDIQVAIALSMLEA